MIVGKELEAWLADARGHRRARAAIDGFASAWRDGPVYRQFHDALAAVPDDSAEAVAGALHALIADHRWVEALIGSLAEALTADAFFEPPFQVLKSDVHHGLIALQDPKASIAVGVSGVAQLAAKKSGARGSTSIGFTGQMTVLKFVRSGDALLSFWEVPRITGDFTAAKAGACACTGRRRMADGDILTIDGRHQSFVIEHARSSLLILQAAISQDQAPLAVEYDSATGSYVGCSTTDDAGSRIQMLSTLLRKLGHDGAFAAVAPFLGHKDFFVRWHVMKELLGIDAEAALPRLKRMAARDPHADVRRAARAVLDGLAAPKARKAA